MRAATLASKAALHFGPSLVYFQSASAQLAAVQSGYRLIRLAGITHFHEGEAARATGIAVSYQTNFLHITMRSKQGSQFLFRRTVRQVANKKVLHPIFSRSRSDSAAAVSSRKKTGVDATG
jgi:hypothetical protein